MRIRVGGVFFAAAVRLGLATAGIVAFALPDLALATDALPVCPAFALKSESPGNPGDLAINNDQVLAWKRSTANQFHARGHVQGTIVKVYPDRGIHDHFSIKIGPNDGDTVEIVYNQKFGGGPDAQAGMPVEACGDYITSTAPAPGPQGQTYPASPDGAIVHYVHATESTSGHYSGYLMINGVLTGQNLPGAGPRPPRPGARRNDGKSPRFDYDAR